MKISWRFFQTNLKLNTKLKQALIIQEDVVMRKILEYLLFSLEYQVKALGSFTEIDLEDQHVLFDVVITDILFEAISPIEFVMQLQETVNCNNIVVLTNMGQNRIRDIILQLPSVRAFFGIPFDLDLLEDQLKEIS